MDNFLEFDLETLKTRSPHIIRKACEDEARKRGTDPKPAIALEKTLYQLDDRIKNGFQLIVKKLK